MKAKRLIALAVAVLTLTMAFAPAALAVTNAPYHWSQWPVQGTENYSTRYAYAVNRFLRLYFRKTGYLTSSELSYYNKLVDSNDKVIGEFSYATYVLVKKFQSISNLDQDGAVGTNTWSKMAGRLLLVEHDNTGAYYTVLDLSGAANTANKAFKYAPSDRWLVNRINGGPYNYIYS